MSQINLDELTEEELVIIGRMADLFRKSRNKREERKQFGQLWARIAAAPPTVSEEEAEAIALEAVAAVRAGV